MKRKGEQTAITSGCPVKKKKKKSNSTNAHKDKDPSLQYIQYPGRTPVIEAARSFFNQLETSTFKVHVGESYGWRTIAKLAVRGTTAPGQVILKDQCIGLFAPGTHKVIPCFSSPVHHPSINLAARAVEQACILHSVSGYREDTSSGLLRYIILAVETSTEKVQCTLVVNCDPQRTSKSDKLVLEKLVQSLSTTTATATATPTGTATSTIDGGLMFHSIWVHSHPASRHDNAITGRLDNSWRCEFGESHLRLSLALANGSTKKLQPKLSFPPNVFRQANLQGFARIIDTIRSYIPNKSKVIELYGGVGTIGLNCLDLCKRLHCSDENPYNVACFDACVDDLVKDTGKEKYRKRAVYLHASASARAEEGVFGKFDLMIVDPPRKGLDVEVLDALMQHGGQGNDSRLKRLVYVSCGFKAFANDCTRLLSKGTWSLIHAEGHVLFPGSDHIETLAIFDRKECI